MAELTVPPFKHLKAAPHATTTIGWEKNVLLSTMDTDDGGSSIAHSLINVLYPVCTAPIFFAYTHLHLFQKNCK